MCRSIKTLRPPFHTPAPSDEDIHAAALQYVRKVNGCHAPSKPCKPTHTALP